jgi:deoxyribonuclease V
LILPESRTIAFVFTCLDADYRDDKSVVAAVAFSSWDAGSSALETVLDIPGAPADYQPGEFYRRELPCLVELVSSLPAQPTLIIVDGYVWIGPERRGLGAHLYDALGKVVPVVGVAKNRFDAAGDEAIEVTRGESARPLYVTSVGIEPSQAAAGISRMAGDHRIPTMLKRVDRLCRDAP